MKAFVLSLLVIASATAHLIPVKTCAINWEAVKDKQDEVYAIISEAVGDVVEQGYLGDEEIGEYIEEYLPATMSLAIEIHNQIIADIEAKTLAEAKAKAYYKDLGFVLNLIVVDLADTIFYLPEENSNKIFEIFHTAYGEVDRLTSEVYVLLQQ